MSKTLMVFAAVTLAVLFGSYYAGENYASEAQKIVFKNWMNKYGKSYVSEAQFIYRFEIYQKNSVYVREHNAKYAAGEESYDLELNLFADLNSEEFKAKYLMKNVKVTKNCTAPNPQNVQIPDELDWSTLGAVTPIKDQGQCGSCWSFSATGSLEGTNFLKTGKLLSFSEQQLVDCSTSYGNQGCNGGWMDDAFFYVADNGIALESKYPYKAVGGSCKYTAADEAFRISNCVDVTVDVEQSLLNAIAVQPVSVAIEANHASFQLYKSGVYNGLCGHNLDHGVLAVGYGSLSGKDYFKVKNSWGSGWGSNGYILIHRLGDGKGKCGILMAPSYSIA